jgi:putative ABC transport system permease protein
MRFLKRLLTRVTNFVTGRQSDRRLREEMEEHLALQSEENLRAGMTLEEARRQARLKFGAVEAVREDYHAEQGLPFIETLLQDVRYALRLFAKSPGFALIAILTMALGVGATTAIFSVVDATLLHPLPYAHPDQLVRIEDDLPGVASRDVGMSIPEMRDVQQSGIFQNVAIEGSGSVNLTDSYEPARIAFDPVTPNYFAMLGVKPELGRWFDPSDRTPGFTLDVMISDGLWKRGFGGDPHILGKTLRLDGDQYQVIGVMPAGFHDPAREADQFDTDLWAATGFSGDPAPPPSRSDRIALPFIGRLSPGISVAAAQSRLDALVASLHKQYPGDYPPQSGWTVRLTPLKESVVGGARQSLLMLLGAVSMVLLIGCVNVANLMLARATARGREMAVRQALGAARSRLVRQLLTESVILSLLGGIAGFAILFFTRGLLLRMIPQSLARVNQISISWNILLFAIAVSFAAGVIFGLAPALQAGRLDLNHTLRQEGRSLRGSREQHRMRGALVVIEFALSLVLLIVAGLLLRSFWDLVKVQLGFNPQQVMAVRMWLPVPNDPKADIYRTPAQEAPLLRELLRRATALPGVKEAAVGSAAAIPLNHDRNPFTLILEGRGMEKNQAPTVEVRSVSQGYFHLLEMPLLRGRLFSSLDDEKSPQVAVINEAMAQTYWPGADALGKRLKSGEHMSGGWVTVVGVIANARTESLAGPSVPQLYLSAYQSREKELAIFLRGQLDEAAIPSEVRTQVRAVNPDLPVFGAQKLDDAVAASLSERRFSMEMVALFAVTALLLAGLGTYGTISYIVSERTQEIGIRLALGAQKGKILRMVLGHGFSLVAIGAAVGLAGALVASHLMAGLLYGVKPTDPLTFVGVTLVLMVVALAACYIPAMRAMRVDPLNALRYE